MAVIELARNAVERFRECVRPSLTFEEAKEELDRLLPLARLEAEAPAWLGEDHRGAGAYSLLSDDTVLALERQGPSHLGTSHYLALSCFTRGD